MEGIHEYRLLNFDADKWTEGFSLPMKLADLWVKYVPRGKGWFPRWVGRHLCREHSVFIRTLHGSKLAVEPSNLDIYTYITSQGNSWDEHVLDACRSVIKKDGVFYDIGASVGYLSTEAAAMLQSGGSVVAFEPQPVLAAIIATSAELNGFGHLQVFNLMLGDHVGDGTLHVGSHSIHASAIPREANSSTLSCLMTTLDAVVEGSRLPPPTVIKIDVEGAELAVLSGAQRTIRRHRPHIIFESDDNMDRYGYCRRDVFDLLNSLCPYEFVFITAEKGRIPVNHSNLESRKHADILAIPQK